MWSLTGLCSYWPLSFHARKLKVILCFNDIYFGSCSHSVAEALAASTVKIAGRDVLATWKVLISLGVVPVLYVLYTVLATIVAVKAGLPLKWKLWTPFIAMAALPCIAFAALKFGEAGMDVLKYVLFIFQNIVD